MTDVSASIHPLSGVMDRHGMLPQEHFFCLGCGKTLNADGGHPAELYAGTWNGLCYGCTARGPFVARISALDGAREVSWPPSCPSHRRDREKFHAYEGCEKCGGLGVGSRGQSMGGGTYHHYCEPCSERYSAHPVRVRYWARRDRIRELAQVTFERKWDEAAGVPRKCSNKRRTELREAFVTSLGEDGWKDFKTPIRDRANVLMARLAGLYAPTGLAVWREPVAEVARFEAAVARRAADLGVTE